MTKTRVHMQEGRLSKIANKWVNIKKESMWVLCDGN